MESRAGGRRDDAFRHPGFIVSWYPRYHLSGFVADTRLGAMHWCSVGMDVRWWVDGFYPIGETLGPGRSCSPTPSGSNRFAPVHVHGLRKPSVGSSVDDLGILTDRAVFVERNVVDYLEKGQYISTVGMNEKRDKMGKLTLTY